MSEDNKSPSTDQYYLLAEEQVTIGDLDISGPILDIGGGGEGIIGQLKGGQVIAIDPNKRELEEAAEGPVKLVMDARYLKFLDNSFEAVTAFFTLMYIQAADHQQVFEEVYRVLKPNGRLWVWDVSLPTRSDQDQDIVVIYLKIKLPDREIETGYGAKWPPHTLDLPYYQRIAEQVGFSVSEQKEDGKVFYVEFKKP